MALLPTLKKKKTGPSTVAEALASFATLRDQLTALIGQNVARRNESFKRIEDARVYAEEVADTETAAIKEADAEIARADRATMMLTNLLGDVPEELIEDVLEEAEAAEAAAEAAELAAGEEGSPAPSTEESVAEEAAKFAGRGPWTKANDPAVKG